MDKKIVILGGGIGGIVAANNLRRKLPSRSSITLIERNKIHTLAASYLWLMVGLRKAEKISAPLSSLVNKGVKIIYEEVKQIDTSGKKIQTENNEISYDYLIIALGTELENKYLSSSQYGIHNFYSFDGAQKLKDELHKIQSGEIIIAIESLPYKCPGAPYEAAMLISDFIKKKGLNKEVTISLITPEPHPLPVAGPELGKSVSDLLENKGIIFFPTHQLTEIKPEGKTITFNSNLTKTYNLLIVIPKHISPIVIRNSELADESGWISVDRNSLETKIENVFAIGDINSISLPGSWNPDKPMKLPKAGVFAHAQALTVSDIISAKILGEEVKNLFCGDGFCMLEAGENLAGFAYGDFFAAPHPDVKMKKMGKAWHLGKVLFEKWWLTPYGFRKSFYKFFIESGGKLFNIPVKL